MKEIGSMEPQASSENQAWNRLLEVEMILKFGSRPENALPKNIVTFNSMRS